MITSIKSNAFESTNGSLGYQTESKSSNDFIELLSEKTHRRDEENAYEIDASRETKRLALIDIIQNKVREIQVKLENGETETAYQIGSDSYTKEEWDNLILKVDRALEKDDDQDIDEDEDKKDDLSGTEDNKKIT